MCASRASILGACWSHCARLRFHRYCRAYGRIAASGSMQEAAFSPQASGRHTADDGNQRPCDIESHLSKEGKARNLSSLSKFIFSFSDIPDMVSLHGGLPNASIFPFKSMKVELEDGTWLDMSAKDKVCCHKGVLSHQPLPQTSHHLWTTSNHHIHHHAQRKHATDYTQ